MSNIIGFCGRCYSGKSELAKLCTEYGYKLMSFGYPLKKLISNLLSINIDEINKLKNIESEYIFKDMDIRFIANETKIPYGVVKEKISDKVFKNTREIMQFIGTDLIRCYNNDWHVNEIKKLLEEDKKYVFDDVRFENEKNMIEDMGGTCWFIIRPKFDCVSNHESETSLFWYYFDNVIINDKDLGTLTLNWKLLMDLGYESMLEERNKIIDEILDNKDNIIDYIVNNEKEFVLLDTYHISKHMFTYEPKYMLKREQLFVNVTENNTLIVNGVDENGNEFSEEVTNQYMMEDLKMYL